jgi:hypothetical protein
VIREVAAQDPITKVARNACAIQFISTVIRLLGRKTFAANCRRIGRHLPNFYQKTEKMPPGECVFHMKMAIYVA